MQTAEHIYFRFSIVCVFVFSICFFSWVSRALRSFGVGSHRDASLCALQRSAFLPCSRRDTENSSEDLMTRSRITCNAEPDLSEGCAVCTGRVQIPEWYSKRSHVFFGTDSSGAPRGSGLVICLERHTLSEIPLFQPSSGRSPLLS